MANKKTKTEEIRKPVIETLINSAALALFSYGTAEVIKGSPNFPFGYLSIIVGMLLEFAKYYGRKREFW